MNIIADTNIFLAVALNEPEKDNIIKLTSGTSALAPEILPYEIGNALSAMVKRKQISRTQALEILQITENVPVKLLRVDIKSSLTIALKHNIYAYDAYFLHLAIINNCPLITLDQKIKTIAKMLNIEILE